MMKFFILIAAILISSVFVVFIAKRKKSNNNALITTNPKSSATNDHYNALREMALGVTEAQLGLHLFKDQIVVYGIVMDMGMDGGTATLTSFSTGDASLYTSTGGGIIGGGQHENVAATAKVYVRVAQSVIEKAQKALTTSLPGKDQVFFYFITNQGKYVIKENMQNLEGESFLKPLFNEGNKVISEIRTIDSSISR